LEQRRQVQEQNDKMLKTLTQQKPVALNRDALAALEIDHKRQVSRMQTIDHGYGFGREKPAAARGTPKTPKRSDLARNS
jgi:hypothetical protein